MTYMGGVGGRSRERSVLKPSRLSCLETRPLYFSCKDNPVVPEVYSTYCRKTIPETSWLGGAVVQGGPFSGLP